ncbi:MAG: DUF5666 domain-containing protein [Candidatus Dadabacteria bacterium]|nr:DUF5666 domain-containing protein [Candidatus Dadabacteria bacterium]
MHTEVCANTLKIYLFFLFISLFAVLGCGLDVDFGGGTEDDDVEKNEVIEGSIDEVDLPDISENPSLVVKAYVVKNDTLECCKDTTLENDRFYIEGNLDPKAELRIFEGENEDHLLGTITVPVFPGAMIYIPDITIDGGPPEYKDIDVIFEGQVASKNCVSDTSRSGSIKVEISSESRETEVTVNLTSATTIERGDDEDNLPCEEVVEGRKVEVDGKLRIGETVDAESIKIL